MGGNRGKRTSPPPQEKAWGGKGGSALPPPKNKHGGVRGEVRFPPPKNKHGGKGGSALPPIDRFFLRTWQTYPNFWATWILFIFFANIIE